MKTGYIFTIFVLIASIGTALAGGTPPPPDPMSVPLDGGASAILLASGAYIGYRALTKKGKGEDK